MPELPEVETVRRTLEPKLIGRKIIDVKILLPKIIRKPDASEFKELIVDKKFRSIDRRGKYLLFKLSKALCLVAHLRMTGQLIYCKKEQEIEKHTHVIFNLDNGSHLRYIDIRQFGGFNLVASDELDSISGLRTLGPEPLSEDFNKEYLKKALRHSRAKIKGLLLDQTFVAGLGNIYVDEALFRAKINPERVGSSLLAREATNLHKAIQEVLRLGIENRGTSLKDYVDGEGRSGDFQKLLQVYGKASEPCPKCSTILVKTKVAGRSTTHCPKCQKSK